MTQALARTSLGALVVLWLVATTSAARGEVLRFATLAPEGSSWGRLLDQAGREIEQKTAGRVKLRFYWGGTAGDERDAIRKLGARLDGVTVTSVGLGMIQPQVRIFELPMLVRSVDELDYVRRRLSPIFARAFEDNGYVLLGWAEIGLIHLFSKAPLRTMGDVARSKLWAWIDDPMVRAIFKELGLPAVPLNLPDVLPALQGGLIDACYGSPYSMVALGWHSNVKYVTSQHLSVSVGAIVISKRSLERLSPPDQQTVRAVMQTYADREISQNRQDNAQAMVELARAGIRTVDSSPGLIGEFERAAARVRKAMIGKLYPASLLAQVEKALSAYRAGAR